MRRKTPALPYVMWMVIFIAVPLLLVVFFALTAPAAQDGAAGDALATAYDDYESDAESNGDYDDADGEDADAEGAADTEGAADGGGVVWTLDNISRVGQFAPALMRSIVLASVATLICLAVGYPVSYIISRGAGSVQRTLLMLTLLPMWMNFLLRTYAWMTLLEKNGLINRFLGLFGIGPLNMINTSGAVVLGMVYNYIPFMILPLFSVMAKIDTTAVEAARDLGADASKVFTRIILPLSMPGVMSGVTMVFVPAVSTFIISRMLGGGGNLLIGDLIDLQFLGNAYNPNLGAAISLLLMVMILLCMSIFNQFGSEEEMEGALL